MSFWGSDIIKSQQALNNIIEPFDINQVKYGSYQLKVGSEVFITSDDVKKQVTHQEMISIAPGQFALILTEEKISIPKNVIAFISIRSGKKLRGLVNVSGFHVDPGFSGKLKFAVYNAGARSIALTRGEPTFLIWFSELLDNNDAYNGDNKNQCHISSEDINNLHGKVASPSTLSELIESTKKELDKRIDEIKSDYDKKINLAEHSITVWRTIIIGVLIALVIIFIKSAFENNSTKSSEMSNAVQSQVSSDVNKQIKEIEKINKLPDKPISPR